MTRDCFSSPDMVRLLLDATTATAAPRRKASRRRSSIPLALQLAFAIAVLVLLSTFFR